MLQTIPIWEYVKSRTRPSDAKNFVAMWFGADPPDAYTVTLNCENYVSDVGGWLKKWRH